MRMMMAMAGVLALAGCFTQPQPMNKVERTKYEREYCQKEGNTDDVLDYMRSASKLPDPASVAIGSSA